MSKVLIDRALLEQALDVIKSEVGLGGTNDYDTWAVAKALSEALQTKPAKQAPMDYYVGGTKLNFDPVTGAMGVGAPPDIEGAPV
jgi:hypothetical protein